MMTIRRLFQSPRARRGIAAGAIVLSLGGLVLYRAPANASPPLTTPAPAELANGVRFSGDGLEGTFALSHGQVLANGPQRVFAELRLTAADRGVAARAPLAMVIALDTSGSMDGDKLVEARRSVVRLLDRMEDDDQVALVRYDTRAQLLQPMARVGDVRRRLASTIAGLEAQGGTNIPDALAVAMREMESAEPGRVRRVVLVSDGLDSNREQSEGLARRGTDAGVTVSSLGIGLDFDESYMVGLSRAGHGNFGFVENPGALAQFLSRELDETAETRVQRASLALSLPQGLQLVRAIGATARVRGNHLTLSTGAIPAGTTRRVVVELLADAEPAAQMLLSRGYLTWSLAGAGDSGLYLDELRLSAVTDRDAVHASRDAQVYASCISALASLQQIEANAAFRHGDAGTALELLEDNQAMLLEAANGVDGRAREGLGAQRRRYAAAAESFKGAPSPGAQSVQKKMAEDDAKNLARPSF